MLFFQDDAAFLRDPRPLGQLGRLGLPYETYKLALTDALLNAVFADSAGNKLDKPVSDTTSVHQLLADAAVSGYLSGADLVARFASVPAAELAGQYWIRSGIAGFADDAAQHFYLPERYTDPFGNVTTLTYDSRDLFIQSSRDPLGNHTEVTRFDFRVLAPQEMRDPNGNLSEVSFDILGMPAAMAVKGKGSEGDTLADVPVDLAIDTLIGFFNGDYAEAAARRLGGCHPDHLLRCRRALGAHRNARWLLQPGRVFALAGRHL